MKEEQNTKDRRKFIKDGLRTVVLSGLAFTSLSLGRRGQQRSGYEESCPIDLPCKICSRLPGCRKPGAVREKLKLEESRYRRPTRKEEPGERNTGHEQD